MVSACLTHLWLSCRRRVNTLTFNCGKAEILLPLSGTGPERTYKTPAGKFELSIIEFTGDQDFTSGINHSADIFIVLKGSVEITDSADNSLRVNKGGTFMVPSVSGKYTIRSLDTGSCLYKAVVPLI